MDAAMTPDRRSDIGPVAHFGASIFGRRLNERYPVQECVNDVFAPRARHHSSALGRSQHRPPQVYIAATASTSARANSVNSTRDFPHTRSEHLARERLGPWSGVVAGGPFIRRW